MSGDEARLRKVEHLFLIIKERYGHRLTDLELEEVKKSLETNLETSDALSKVKLENSDEPFSIFMPLWRRRP